MGLFAKKHAISGVMAGIVPGARGIAAAQVRHQAGRAPVLDFCDYVPLQTERDMARSFSRLVKTRRLTRVACNVMLGLGDYTLLLVESPDVPAGERRAAIRWRIRDLVDFDIDDAVIDVFELPPHKGEEQSPMIYAVVARGDRIERCTNLFRQAGARLNAIDIPELVIRNVAALLPEDTSGVAFLYLDEMTGLITLTRQDVLYLSRRIDTGQTRIRELAPGGHLTPRLEGWLDGIIIEIQRSLDYYESHYAQPPVSGLVVSPLQQPVAGLGDYLASQLGISTRILDLNTLVDSSTPIPDELQGVCLPALGAALRELETGA